MHNHHTHRTGVAVLVVLAIAGFTAGLVRGASWAPPSNLSQPQPIQDRDRVGIAAAANDTAAIWAGSQPGAGVTIARRQGATSPWSKIQPGTIIPGQVVWSPVIAHSGSEIVAAWAEGGARGGCTTRHKVVSYSIVGAVATRKTVKDPIYSPVTAPDIAVNAAGWHMVFVGSPTEADCVASRHGLYYSFRAAGSQTWSAPSLVVTHNAVRPDAYQGGVWYPRMATVPGSTAIHIVWEQFLKYAGSSGIVSETSIWLMSGTASGGPAVWGTPVQLSPGTQQYAARPIIAAGAANRVQIVWTHLIGSRTSPTEQYVYYRPLQSATLTALNTEPNLVNSNFPTVASSSIVAQGDTVCAAWHGYYGSLGTGREEIRVRCSNDGGSSWGSAVNVSESADLLSIFPAMTRDPSGVMHFAWAEYDLVGTSYAPVAVYYRNDDEPTAVFLPIVVRRR